jgi:hypothetical protein
VKVLKECSINQLNCQKLYNDFREIFGIRIESHRTTINIYSEKVFLLALQLKKHKLRKS